MSDNQIVYQLAVNSLSKISLRLERLFLGIEQSCHAANPIIHHYALKNIIEISLIALYDERNTFYFNFVYKRFTFII